MPDDWPSSGGGILCSPDREATAPIPGPTPRLRCRNPNGGGQPADSSAGCPGTLPEPSIPRSTSLFPPVFFLRVPSPRWDVRTPQPAPGLADFLEFSAISGTQPLLRTSLQSPRSTSDQGPPESAGRPCRGRFTRRRAGLPAGCRPVAGRSPEGALRAGDHVGRPPEIRYFCRLSSDEQGCGGAPPPALLVTSIVRPDTYSLQPCSIHLNRSNR